MITIKWSLCLIFCISNSVLVIAKDLCLPDQRDALLEFKNEFYVQSSYEMMSYAKTEKWRNKTDCCSWDGVSCDPKTGVVVDLNLEFSNLNGPLRSNSTLLRLQHLQSLDLGNNYLSGILPDSIGNLKYLSDSMGNLNRLTDFQLMLLNMSSLTYINLGFNQFRVMLPSNMSSLSKLRFFYIRENSFSGTIPSSLFMIPSLTWEQTTSAVLLRLVIYEKK
ncbi:receptor like protein 30-like [Arabidopsis lyrata subsp. lyrata]|uniref:receptor like protein 30-like n=1 Tax=Arabidopsis lyrata subsp. lyrata TaxID=81972 RepID=UPI000A29B02A|nr:receptor like protein 30-like [Arabidopsis lyrata subsp. lyrata]|eukprot:XP_020872782.1 receptor like protein 30-like [Arabidopsis lyrata subsp. lyrata]